MDLQPQDILNSSMLLSGSIATRKRRFEDAPNAVRVRGVSNERNRRTTYFEEGRKRSSDDMVPPKQLIIYESILSDYVLIDEFTQQHSRDIVIYSQCELTDLLKKGQLLSLRPSNLQATLWSTKLDFNIRNQLWEYFADINGLKQANIHFNYRANIQICKQDKDEQQIGKDLHRTFNSCDVVVEKSEQIQRLKNILTAYSNFDPEIGYTQGMNFLVSNLLMAMSVDQNLGMDSQEFCVIDNSIEETIFWVLVHIMTIKDWRSMYLYDTPGIFSALNQLRGQMLQHCPLLLDHINWLGVPDLSLLFGSYYLSLLTHNTPRNLCHTVISFFLWEGLQFFNNFILQVVIQYQNHILSINDVGELLSYFRKDIFLDFELRREKILGNENLISALQQHNLISDTMYSKAQLLLQQPYQEQQEQSHGGILRQIGSQLKDPLHIPGLIGSRIKRMFVRQQ